MSFLPQQIPLQQYIADGTTAIYAYNFLILQAVTSVNDIAVFVTPFDQPPIPTLQLQPLNVAYTVQNIGTLTGGTITFQPGYIPDSASIITIVRNMNVSIDTEFNQIQNFNGQNLDNAFKRVILIDQDFYALQRLRGLSYAINALLPTDSTDQTLPVLGNSQIWKKVNNAIQAVTLEDNPDISTLRSELASQVPGSDGASLIGYFDEYNNVPEQLSVFLNNLPAYINNVVSPTDPFKPGMMLDFAGYTAPTGFFMCDGSEKLRSTYPLLFSAITFFQNADLFINSTTVSGLTSTDNMFIGMKITGSSIQPGTTITLIVDLTTIHISLPALTVTTSTLTFYPYGSGDESTTFNIPDCRRRSTIGSGGTVISNPLGVGNIIGQTGGEELHHLTETENGPHFHTYALLSSPLNGVSGIDVTGTGPASTANTSTSGTGAGHNNYQPNITIMKIIKYA